MVAAFTGEGAANEALLVGLVDFPLTFIAFLIVIPDHGSTGAAIVSCCSYVAASALAALSVLPRARASARPHWFPRTEDLRDYERSRSPGVASPARA